MNSATCKECGWFWSGPDAEQNLKNHLDGPYHKAYSTMTATHVTAEELNSAVKKIMVPSLKKTLNSPTTWTKLTKAYKCYSCYLMFTMPLKLADHLVNYHGFFISEAYTYLMKHYPEDCKGLQPETAKEAHMPDTMTITTQKIGEAKKARNILRQRLRDDVNKYVSKFGCSHFEALHAIVDTVIIDTDRDAQSYSKPGMPNALAQTLLPFTQQLIDQAHGGPIAPTVKSSTILPGAGALIWDDPVQPSAVKKQPVWGKKVPMPLKGKTLLDKDVTPEDISAEIYTYGPSWKYIKADYEMHKDDPNHYYVWGSGYMAPNKWISGVSGYKYVIVKISKAKPYISAQMLQDLNLHIHHKYFKFRKLKNKPIYKYQQYSGLEEKSTPYSESVWAKYSDGASSLAKKMVKAYVPGGINSTSMYVSSPKDPAYITAYPLVTAKNYPTLEKGYMWINNHLKNHSYVVAVHSGMSVTIGEAIVSKAPLGFHWETLLSDSKKACLMENVFGYDDSGDPLPSSPKAKFPPKSSSWIDAAEYGKLIDPANLVQDDL